MCVRPRIGLYIYSPRNMGSQGRWGRGGGEVPPPPLRGESCVKLRVCGRDSASYGCEAMMAHAGCVLFFGSSALVVVSSLRTWHLPYAELTECDTKIQYSEQMWEKIQTKPSSDFPHYFLYVWTLNSQRKNIQCFLNLTKEKKKYFYFCCFIKQKS